MVMQCKQSRKLEKDVMKFDITNQPPRRESMETTTCPHHIKRIVLACLFVVIIAGMITTRGVHAAGQPPPLQLLTNEEAALPESRSHGFSSPSSDNGPAIGVPDMDVVESSPFRLKIGLAPRNGVALDLASLRMECLKNPAVDLSPRIRPYVTQEGVKIDSVTLPAGLHHFRVSISDVRGRLSEKDFTIVVSARF